jgi:UDP-N-acetylmuramyl tripeptide synthase
MERVAVGAGWLVLTLVKNPVGFNQALAATEDRFAAGGNAGDPPGLVLFAINDLLADGTDVSWLWDVDFESTVTAHGFRALCSGLRAHDMALRLKYSGMGEGRIEIDPDLDGALRQACDRALDGDTVPIFATYTAMLALRRTLQARGLVAPLWED